jgi:hypothetical protein
MTPNPTIPKSNVASCIIKSKMADYSAGKTAITRADFKFPKLFEAGFPVSRAITLLNAAETVPPPGIALSEIPAPAPTAASDQLPVRSKIYKIIFFASSFI